MYMYLRFCSTWLTEYQVKLFQLMFQENIGIFFLFQKFKFLLTGMPSILTQEMIIITKALPTNSRQANKTGYTREIITLPGYAGPLFFKAIQSLIDVLRKLAHTVNL